jgi:2-polyprenyl-3-methyl-5-hydroxy-6-metoxy-1,4-benzoquinol methylase
VKYMINLARRLKIRFDSLLSWTSELGKPRPDFSGLAVNEISYAVYSPEIDAHLRNVKEQAQLNYPYFARAPHALNYFDNQWSRMNVIIGLLRDMPPGAVGLDVGIAYGFLDLVLRDQYGLNIFGADLKQSIDIFSEFAISQRIKLCPWDITSEPLPFEPGSFQFVIFAEVLEHLRCPASRVMQKLADCLCPGGTLNLTTPNIARYYNVWRLSRGLNILAPYPNEVPIGADAMDYVDHPREYTIGEVVRLVYDAGLNVNRVIMVNARRSPACANPYLDETMCVICQKSPPADVQR